jgi:hypothetical protein
LGTDAVGRQASAANIYQALGFGGRACLQHLLRAGFRRQGLPPYSG